MIFATVAHVAWTGRRTDRRGLGDGGVLGARYGRRLPPGPLRALIVAVGIIAVVRLLFP